MDKSTEDIPGRLHVNIRGQVFEIEASLVQKLPGTLLARLDRKHGSYCRETGKYFFNRDPVIFNCIVNYYVTG